MSAVILKFPTDQVSRREADEIDDLVEMLRQLRNSRPQRYRIAFDCLRGLIEKVSR